MTPSCHGVASTVHARCPAHGVACPVSLTPLQRCAAKFFAHSLHFWDGYNFSYDFVSLIMSETHSVFAFGSVRLRSLASRESVQYGSALQRGSAGWR